jgi:hypothetical protein
VLRGQGVEPPRPGRTDAIQTQLGPPAPAYGPPTSPTPDYVPPMGTGDGPALAPPTPALGQRSFGPLTPLEPRYSPESAEGQAPRRFQFPVGVNILVQPRQDFPGLTPFEQLRNLSDIYDVSAMCIAARIEQVQGMGYSCVANDKRKQRQFKDECEEVEKFMDRPDGITPFLTWLGIAIREHLVTDALTVFPRRNYGGGLARLQLIDGATIKPVLDDEGNVRGYQQILYGYPFSDYHQPMDEREAEQAFPIYSPNELLYLPRFASINTPYGKPPTEFIILRVNQALRKQMFDLSYFCFSSDTEILTEEKGWVKFPDLAGDERVATRSRSSELEWQLPNHFNDQPYDSDLLHFKSDTVDLLVTPNHRMLVAEHQGAWHIERADAFLRGGAAFSAGYDMIDQDEKTHPVPFPKAVPYNGRVYCVSVPNGIIYVRRNGRAIWSGNTEGNIPEMLATMPEGTMTAEQVDEFERWFNSVLAGNDKERRRMRFIPWQAQVQELRPFTYETTLDEWMLRVTCAAYAVPPQELGFTNDVNRATAELQEAVNERRGLKPLSTWFKRAVFDPIIHTMFDPNFKPGRALSVPGQPTHTITSPFREIGWSWSFGDKSDLAIQAQTDSTYIDKFVLSKDEVRALRFSDLVEGPAPLTDEEKAALKEAQAAGTAPPTPSGEGGELGVPAGGGPAPAGGAPTPGVEAAPAGGGPAPAGPTGVAGATAPPAPAGEAVTAAITAEWRKIEDTLYIRDGVKRDQVQRRIYDRVRQAMDKWAYNLSRAATIGNNPYSLYHEMEDEIRNAIRRELVDYQERENRDLNFELMARANAGDLRDEFVDDLFESLLPVCLKTPPGGYVYKEQVHFVLTSILPRMAEKAASRFPAKLNTDLVKMSKAEVSNYQTAFGAWLADSINWTSAWAMEVSAGTDPLELALTLAHLEATRIFSAPLGHAITLLNQSTLRKATPGLKPLGGPGIIPPASESRGDVGPTPATPAPKARPAEEQGGIVVAPPAHLHCRCSLHARKIGDQWLAIWYTRHADACTEDRKMPWGTVAGCLDMKNRCVTSGSKLGLRIAELSGDLTGQQAEEEVQDEGGVETEGAYFAERAPMQKGR